MEELSKKDYSQNLGLESKDLSAQHGKFCANYPEFKEAKVCQLQEVRLLMGLSKAEWSEEWPPCTYVAIAKNKVALLSSGYDQFAGCIQTLAKILETLDKPIDPITLSVKQTWTMGPNPVDEEEEAQMLDCKIILEQSVKKGLLSKKSFETIAEIDLK